MHARAVCPPPWPTGKGLTLKSQAPGIPRPLQGTHEVPVAAAFSACHVWDRWGCSCPLGYAAQKSKAPEMFSRIQAAPQRAARSCGHLWKVEMYCSA